MYDNVVCKYGCLPIYREKSIIEFNPTIIEFNPTFIEAWEFLNNHKYFKHPKEEYNMFKYCLDIHVTKVNPVTKSTDHNLSERTETNVWLEAGKWLDFGKVNHDIKLDTGGKTFEEAIVNMAKLVKQNYGGDYVKR